MQQWLTSVSVSQKLRGLVLDEVNFLKALNIRHVVRNLIDAVVVFLKFLVEVNDHLQVRSRQRYPLVHSEGISSDDHVLDLDVESAKLQTYWFNSKPVDRLILSSTVSRDQPVYIWLGPWQSLPFSRIFPISSFSYRIPADRIVNPLRFCSGSQRRYPWRDWS